MLRKLYTETLRDDPELVEWIGDNLLGAGSILLLLGTGWAGFQAFGEPILPGIQYTGWRFLAAFLLVIFGHLILVLRYRLGFHTRVVLSSYETLDLISGSLLLGTVLSAGLGASILVAGGIARVIAWRFHFPLVFNPWPVSATFFILAFTTGDFGFELEPDEILSPPH